MEVKNLERLKSAFATALEIELDRVNDELKYQGIPEWDSITHMILISEIEAEFNIEINPDHVLEMNTYNKVQELLSNYNISSS